MGKGTYKYFDHLHQPKLIRNSEPVVWQVAEDEAKHFSLLSRRLTELGSHYGAHTVHAGLWDSALETSTSLLDRLAIIHLVAEARGLDVNPVTIEKFRRQGDLGTVEVLEVIHNDEITRAVSYPVLTNRT